MDRSNCVEEGIGRRRGRIERDIPNILSDYLFPSGREDAHSFLLKIKKMAEVLTIPQRNNVILVVDVDATELDTRGGFPNSFDLDL